MRAGGAFGRQENDINSQQDRVSGSDGGAGAGAAGVLRVVGFGPGAPEDRTRRAEEAIRASEVVAGYGPYLERIRDLLGEKELIVSGMTQERERVEAALVAAAAGKRVALVSSGDSGIYGMAGLAIELAAAYTPRPRIQLIPGVTAACGAAALLGAPLMLDYATLSLSDLLVPWAEIEKRLRAAVAGGFVLALYNPKSRSRTEPFRLTCAILREALPGGTPTGICRAMGSAEESVTLTDVAGLEAAEIDMRSIVIVGNANCRIVDGWFINPRGYFATAREMPS